MKLPHGILSPAASATLGYSSPQRSDRQPSAAQGRNCTATAKFDALNIAESATLVIETGEVVAHVSSALDHRGQTRLRDADARIVLVFFGTSPAVIRSSLQGVVVAPYSTLSLGDAYNSRFRGRFFAHSVEVLPGTVIDLEQD